MIVVRAAAARKLFSFSVNRGRDVLMDGVAVPAALGETGSADADGLHYAGTYDGPTGGRADGTIMTRLRITGTFQGRPVQVDQKAKFRANERYPVTILPDTDGRGPLTVFATYLDTSRPMRISFSIRQGDRSIAAPTVQAVATQQVTISIDRLKFAVTPGVPTSDSVVVSLHVEGEYAGRQIKLDTTVALSRGVPLKIADYPAAAGTAAFTIEA